MKVGHRPLNLEKPITNVRFLGVFLLRRKELWILDRTFMFGSSVTPWNFSLSDFNAQSSLYHHHCT
jgi:hypothetical protein